MATSSIGQLARENAAELQIGASLRKRLWKEKAAEAAAEEAKGRWRKKKGKVERKLREGERRTQRERSQ